MTTEKLSLTPMEEQVWLMAYTTNQPQSKEEPYHNLNYHGHRVLQSSIYWAGAAVYHLRGDSHPTQQQCIDLYEYMKDKNRSQRELM